ncbi:DUF6088 family protein [Myroides sp. DW712]|uniref:DUF6088 family protein n=1 Tax=Myroides sp. DW712 TaxID=3389800 RepID=UPI003978D483
MKRLDELKKHLKRGSVYRRSDLMKWSNAVDRHLTELVNDGTLQKLSQGLYYYPKETVFGAVPPDEKVLVRSFLKDNKFLLTSPNDYNKLGVGTTQLYNKRVVYNRKRHGEFELGGRKFFFHAKPRFPKEVTQEFLLVDLVNNLDTLAEDTKEVLSKVRNKVKTMDVQKLHKTVKAYGGARAKKVLTPLLNTLEQRHYA